MTCSTGFILYNKWMYTTGGFPYPMTLTAMHMGSCYLIFGCLSWLPQHIRKRFMPDIDKTIPADIYMQGLVPAALLMSLSLGIGNLGFLYASVAFIQMIKPVNVVVTSIAGFAWGLEVFTPSHAIIACIVSGGVSMAAFGSISNFSAVGLACQLTASVSEGLRLILLQGVLHGRLRLDPLTTVYRFAPSAGLWLCCFSFILEANVDWSALPNLWVLPLNCLVAVLLNVLIVSVIAETSAVVFVLAGVTKDIATIALSVCIYGTPIRAVEILGYSTSVAGICLFKVYKDHLQLFKELGFIQGMANVCSKKLSIGQ
jgi:drug/metabolite transporter (DMT)-like permease